MSGSFCSMTLRASHLASGLSFAYSCVERVFLWPTSVPMVYKGTFLLANHEQNVCRNV